MTHSLGVNVGIFIGLLAAALVVSIAAERLPIPAAVLLVAVGIAAGSPGNIALPFAFGPALLYVFLPPLIFSAAWSIALEPLRRSARAAALLAFPGSLFTALAIAGGLVAVGALPFGPALLVGAMAAATDPVAVVAVFRTVRAPAAVRTTVEAESLANDGVAVILYAVGVTLAQGQPLHLAGALAWGVGAAVGGVAIGAACALVIAVVVRVTTRLENEVIATVALAYGSYLAADAAHASGIFASAAAAVALRAVLHGGEEVLENAEEVDRFWISFTAIAEGVVFIATGLSITLPRAFHEPVLVAVTVTVVFASRALLAFAAGRSGRSRITIFMAGMRGALPLALALSLPANVQNRPQIIDAVFATVLFTLVIQGLPLQPILGALYATPKARARGEQSR